MLRIAYRPIVVLLSAVMLVSLIATRPLTPPSETARAGRALTRPPVVSTPIAAAPGPALPTLEQELRAEMIAMRAAARAATLAAPRPAPLPARIEGAGPRMRGQLVTQTERLDLYIGKNSFSGDQVAALAPKIEQALRSAEAHFGTTLQHRVSLGFYRTPPKRGVRGMAYTGQGRAELYYRPGEDTGRALTIAAHELGHHLEAQRYGEAAQRRTDTILHEGMATWIAAGRWLPMCDATTWRARARKLQRAGIPLRLLTAERSGADNAYELWASFVDFLAQRYGWEKLDELYRSGRGRAPGSANYQGVLGKNLDDLADEWRAWIET
jgi:hypothetical protein